MAVNFRRTKRKTRKNTPRLELSRTLLWVSTDVSEKLDLHSFWKMQDSTNVLFLFYLYPQCQASSFMLSATDKQRICVFTQLNCLKTQLRFTGLRTEKQKKSSIRKSDYFLCVQPYFNSCQNTGCLPNCACTCV